jgi:hypothetical protein
MYRFKNFEGSGLQPQEALILLSRQSQGRRVVDNPAIERGMINFNASFFHNGFNGFKGHDKQHPI